MLSVFKKTDKNDTNISSNVDFICLFSNEPAKCCFKKMQRLILFCLYHLLMIFILFI